MRRSRLALFVLLAPLGCRPPAAPPVASDTPAAETASAPADADADVSWDTIDTRSEFPDVPHLTTAELAAWIADDERGAPVLIDVREPEEFAVSHLPGAQRAMSVDDALSAANGRPIVLYCSVGVRSAWLARELRSRGHDNVWNLAGSIFRWANENRPLEGSDGPAQRVHPYDVSWGKLLDESKRADL